MKHKLFRKADLFLIVAALLAAAALFLFRPHSEGSLTAFLYENGALVREIRMDALKQPEEVSLAGGRLTVYAEPAKIQILFSDCPSQTCVHTGVLTKSGDTAVCVPNRVTVVLRGGGERQYQTY